jgi:hypothetical protein
MSISAHTHTHEHHYITKEDGWQGRQPHHHVVNVTVSGNWWGGAPDERGIPHTTMRDGAPNGHSLMTFDGQKYSLEFHAAGRPKNYQMEIMLPEVVAPESLKQTTVYANVFNADAKANVRFRVNESSWQPMQRTVEVDPLYQAVYDAENAVLKKYEDPTTGKTVNAPWRGLYKPELSTHLWKAQLPSGLEGLCVVEVQANAMDGKTYTAQQTFRVEPVAAAANASHDTAQALPTAADASRVEAGSSQ